MKISKSLLLMLVAIGVVGTSYAWWRVNDRAKLLVISGVIEADDVHVGSKFTERVLKVVATEGQTVKAGEILVLLEPEELDAAFAEAQSLLRQASAKHALLSPGYIVKKRSSRRRALTRWRAGRSGICSFVLPWRKPGCL